MDTVSRFSGLYGPPQKRQNNILNSCRMCFNDLEFVNVQSFLIANIFFGDIILLTNVS